MRPGRGPCSRSPASDTLRYFLVQFSATGNLDEAYCLSYNCLCQVGSPFGVYVWHDIRQPPPPSCLSLQRWLLPIDEVSSKSNCVRKLSACLCLQHERFHSAPASLVGTTEYLSPEVIRSAGKKAYNGRVSPWNAHSSAQTYMPRSLALIFVEP